MIDFEALLGALNREGLEFIVVDGAAATAHGAARLTQDLDVVYARSNENMERSGLSQRIIRIFAARPRGFRSFGTRRRFAEVSISRSLPIWVMSISWVRS